MRPAGVSRWGYPHGLEAAEQPDTVAPWRSRKSA
jgi:hypothetical protein